MRHQNSTPPEKAPAVIAASLFLIDVSCHLPTAATATAAMDRFGRPSWILLDHVVDVVEQGKDIRLKFGCRDELVVGHGSLTFLFIPLFNY